MHVLSAIVLCLLLAASNEVFGQIIAHSVGDASNIADLNRLVADAHALEAGLRFDELLDLTKEVSKIRNVPHEIRGMRARAYLMLQHFDEARLELASFSPEQRRDENTKRMQVMLEIYTGNRRAAEELIHRFKGENHTGSEWNALLAQCWLRGTANDKIKADALIIRCLKENPKERRMQSLCVSRLLEKRKNDAAVIVATLMINTHPELTGGAVSLTTPISRGDLAFGKAQVDSFLSDRAKCIAIRNKDREIMNWLIKGFAGGGGDGRIEWNEENPLLWTWSSNAPPTRAERGFVAVNKWLSFKARELNRDEILSCLVYEMYNIQASRKQLALVEVAKRGAIQRDDFAVNLAYNEYSAHLRARAFYLLVYEPWAARNGIETDPVHWGLTTCNTFEEYALEVFRQDGYPFRVYGSMYDELRE
jgi:hypothetical protein